MLRLSSLFFSIGIALLARSQAPQLGGTIEKEFAVTEIPEKWKNESAVIIGQKTEYLFTRKSLNRKSAVVKINEYIHKRIKLQDKNALEAFSTFYYVTMGADGNASYKVIKNGGKEIDIDMKSAIEEENDVPAIYKPIVYKMNIKKMKIAIPNLEVGDIIDYTIKSTIDWDMVQNGAAFAPFIFTMANNYPTMFQQYRFTMANGMKVRYRAFNGAPNIRFDPKASVYGDNNSYLSYYFQDKERDKQVEERWSFEYRNLPTVKFRVVMYSDNDGEEKGLGEATVDRSGVDIAEVYKRYAGAALYQTPTVNAMVGYTTEYISKKKADGLLKTDDDVIRETYNCLRKVFLEMYYKGPVHSELAKVMTGKRLYKKVLAVEKNEKKEERQDEIRINGVTFATAMRMSLAAAGIPSELFVYVPRKLGKWKDAIFLEEFDFMFRVKYKKKFLYLDAFNNFDAFGTQYPYMENVEGYAIGYTERDQYFRATISPSTAKDHIDSQYFRLTLPGSMDWIQVDRTTSLLGAEKIGKVESANMTREYLQEDFEKYFNDSKKKKSDMVIQTSNSYENPDKEEKLRERKELFEKSLKENYDVDRYQDFSLVKDGRYGDTAWLEFREKFTLEKLLSKAGRNHILEIGKLIGGQIKLEPAELQARQTDIWLSNARTLHNTIELTIPDGYTVEGLKDLEFNVDNESGAFITTAKVEENKLIVTARKLYKKSFDRKETWPNYIAFLEAAYKFSQAKIVLKKK